MYAALSSTDTPHHYDSLMAMRWGSPLEETLAQILSSWLRGDSAMPAWLGLGERRFSALLLRHFPGYPIALFAGVGEPIEKRRLDEADDLRRLLMRHRSGRNDSERWMADIVVAGCMGNDHLWQDLGLWNRKALSGLMMDNFEPLARRNDKDMKWKKFLYKQLCETEGIYTCRAPSCEVCADYVVCFGPEE
jgi:nitrogen fixation protein NifQ